MKNASRPRVIAIAAFLAAIAAASLHGWGTGYFTIEPGIPPAIYVDPMVIAWAAPDGSTLSFKSSNAVRITVRAPGQTVAGR